MNNPSLYFGINSGRINDFNFDDLTASYLNIAPGATNATLFEMLGNRPFGIIRSSVVNSDQLSGSGWDLQLGN